jgi:hypothetical protein
MSFATIPFPFPSSFLRHPSSFLFFFLPQVGDWWDSEPQICAGVRERNEEDGLPSTQMGSKA